MILEKIEVLSDDNVSGSSELILKAIDIYVEAIGTNVNLNEVKNQIIGAKPSMVGIRNILDRIDELLVEIPKSEIKSMIYREFQTSREATINSTVEYLLGNSVGNVFTCSYSSSVLEVLENYFSLKADSSLYAVNSFWKGINYGKFYKQKLSKEIGRIKLIDIDEIFYNNKSIGLLGADQIVRDKYIVNGFPSKEFAERLNDLGVPLLIVAERFKVTDIGIIEDGFEEVPFHLIAKIISY